LPGLHIEIGGRIVRQRGRGHIRAVAHLLHVCEGREHGVIGVVLGLRFWLLLYGFGVGRIRVHNQFDPAVRAGASDHGQVFHAALCSLQLHVYLGNAARYADSVCGVSACSIRGAYGGHGGVLLDAGIASYSLQLLLHFLSLLSFRFTLPHYKKKKCLIASFWHRLTVVSCIRAYLYAMDFSISHITCIVVMLAIIKNVWFYS
jgi:hypothetical protein